MEKENVNPTNVTQDVGVKYEDTGAIQKDTLTKIQKSIGGVKGSLVHTNQKVASLAQESRKTQDAISELQAAIGTLVGKIECLAYKVNQPWYKRLFK